jgi:GNAT superfamily N-acetyltransferase
MQTTVQTQYKYREAKLSEAQIVVDVIVSAYNTDDGWSNDVEFFGDKRTNLTEIENYIKSKETIVFVLENEAGEIISTFLATIINQIPKLVGSEKYLKNSDKILIHLLAVLPKYQSKGIARKMFNYLETFFVETKDYLVINKKLDGLKEKYELVSSFVEDNREKLINCNEFVLGVVEEKVDLCRFYERVGYKNIGYRQHSKFLRFNGLPQKRECHMVIKTKPFFKPRF